MTVTLEELHALAEAWMSDSPTLPPDEGAPLDALTAALVDFGCKSSTTALDGEAIDRSIAAARAAGATDGQLGEVLALVSGLGVHSLVAAAGRIVKTGERANVPLDPEQQKLWDKHVGTDPYWVGFEKEFPGFLDALLRLSPDAFRAFFPYCAVPWRGREVPALTKELISMASDASTTHRFLPGFRLHLGKALELGASRRTIRDTLALAAACPPHVGYR